MQQEGVICSQQDVVTAGKLWPDWRGKRKAASALYDPDGGRNIRLKGMIYERDFKFAKG